MDAFVVRSIVIPIVVAVLGTLLIEYVAKPGLEARKDRILRSRAGVDEMIFSMQRMSLLASQLPTDAELKSVPALRVLVDDLLADLTEATKIANLGIARLSPRYAEKHSQHLTNTSTFLGFLRGLCLVTLIEPSGRLDTLKDAYSELQYFDIYFRVHLGLRDSQEATIKRVLRVGTKDADLKRATRDALERQNLPSAPDPA